ncbi:unnamed protein product [Linum tenue]|uniref:Rho-GAP domain-containing protein n=1 Tax=Linum tenue TaxID=586396 RepID=A0AAV0MWK4_9ROSI|nr:unnamed protein product [Linum tenue]
MPSAVSPQWQEKATVFFSTSGVKLKEAGNSAGTFVGEVAKDAKGNVADAAERVGSAVKSRWAILKEPSTRHILQERFITAAATTGMFLRKGFSETKDKVSVGKTKVEEVAKKTAQKSKVILTDIERWQKGVASTDVFGVPIELTVQRQQYSRPVPIVLLKCADYLILSGLNSVHLFKDEGEKVTVQHLVSLFNQDFDASLPDGINPIDVAFLMKCYLASLPEPLTTFEHYDAIKGARSNIHAMRNILKRLPTVNYMTLEFVTALFLRVSQKSLLNKARRLCLTLSTSIHPSIPHIVYNNGLLGNPYDYENLLCILMLRLLLIQPFLQMDARSLAMEMAPVVMWRKEQRPESYRQYWNSMFRNSSKTDGTDGKPTLTEWDLLSEEGEEMEVSSAIPLDDGAPVDFGAIEVIQCLIEQHNSIFTDANETVWR